LQLQEKLKFRAARAPESLCKGKETVNGQKVSAPVEVGKPAPQMVLNNP
jgi:hypothetical protein